MRLRRLVLETAVYTGSCRLHNPSHKCINVFHHNSIPFYREDDNHSDESCFGAKMTFPISYIGYRGTVGRLLCGAL